MNEKRKEPRYQISVPVELRSGAGTTVDLSGTGLAFETADALAVGDEIELTVCLPRAGGEPLRLECAARIVRIQKTRYIERGRERLRVGASVEWAENLDELVFNHIELWSVTR